MTDDEKAEAYTADLFAQNPDGFTIAPYVNEHTTTDAFLAGAAHARQNPGPEVLALVEALECVKAHAYGRTDLFATMENTVKRAISQWRKVRGAAVEAQLGSQESEPK